MWDWLIEKTRGQCKAASNPLAIAGSKPPCNTMCLGSPRVSTLNRTSIGLAVLHSAAAWQTDTPRYGSVAVRMRRLRQSNKQCNDASLLLNAKTENVLVQNLCHADGQISPMVNNSIMWNCVVRFILYFDISAVSRDAVTEERVTVS